MLGPSGSGKTTVLRLIAGFELPTAGTVELGGDDVTRPRAVRARRQHRLPGLRAVPAHDVLDNVELRPAGAQGGRAERRARAEAGAGDGRARTGIGRRAARPAVRRAAAARRARPRAGQPTPVLLLDEPLGALDLKLREQMQVELKADPARGRHHLRLRHPRPGGGAHHERPGRGLQQGPDRAGRHARARSTSGRRRAFVAGLRRHLQPARRRGRRRAARRGRRVHRAPGEDRGCAATASPAPSTATSVAGGTVAEVVYAGSATRYLVDLDAGARAGRPACTNDGRRPTWPVAATGCVAGFARRDCRRLRRRRHPTEPTPCRHGTQAEGDGT